MSLEPIEIPGLLSLVTIRTIHRRTFGIPPGGPIDPEHAHIAHRFFNNADEKGLLEIWFAGQMRWRALHATWVACAGAGMHASVDGQGIRLPARFLVRAGAELMLSAEHAGQIGYLSLDDGVRQLTPTLVPSSYRSFAADSLVPKAPERPIVPVMPGPDDLDLQELLGREFTLDPRSNRLGWRLVERLDIQAKQRRSEPTVPGTIQLTPNGSLIILGPDGPTLGGYPRIGVIPSHALGQLGRIGFGVKFKFLRARLGAGDSAD